MYELIEAVWQTVTFGTGNPTLASFLFVPTVVGLIIMLNLARRTVELPPSGNDETTEVVGFNVSETNSESKKNE
jgi:hypothetical protein